MAELFDIVVRRQIYVEGLKAGKANEFAALLAALRKELQARLATIEFTSLGDMTKTALRQLLIDLKKIAQSIFDPWLKSLIEWLQRYMNVDRDLLVALFGPQAVNQGVEAPDGPKLFAAAWARPMAATGTLAAPFLAGVGVLTAVKLQRAAMMAYANRAKRDDLVRSILGTSAARYNDGLLASINRAGGAATNTVIQHLSAQSNDMIAALLFDWYEWVSVLDGKTTPICISRDGNRYRYGAGPIPPAHVGCRSTTVPILSPDAPPTPNDFQLWAAAQSTDFINDAFDGSVPSRYEGSHAISLADYAGKRTLIGV